MGGAARVLAIPKELDLNEDQRRLYLPSAPQSTRRQVTRDTYAYAGGGVARDQKTSNGNNEPAASGMKRNSSGADAVNSLNKLNLFLFTAVGT
jgi:hypothetical protein